MNDLHIEGQSVRIKLQTEEPQAQRCGLCLRLKQWLQHSQQSNIPALQRFAKVLKPYWRGIISRVQWPMHTGQLEGINNRIKVIKRTAYEYRNTYNFFLKIKATFLENP